MEKKRETRFRNYATVVYPESAPDNWVSILEDVKVAAFISPLHDQDYNPDGEVKKAHYHVIIMFDSVKTDVQAREIFNSIGGVGCECVKSIRGYARYLCHLDNPDKAQYDTANVRSLSGADYPSVIDLVIDKHKAVREILEYIKNNDIMYYSDVVDYASLYRDDWFRVLCDSCTYVIKEYLKSRKWKRDDRASLSQ